MNTDIQPKLNSIVSGVASLVMGVVLFSNPTGVALMAVSIVGVILLVLGAVSLFNYFRPGGDGTQVNLFVGIAELVFGAILWFMPGFFVNWIVVIVGIFILVMGLGDLSVAWTAYRARAPFAMGKFIMAAVTVLVGFFVIVSPFAFVDMAFIIAGIGLVINGVTELIAAFKD